MGAVRSRIGISSPGNPAATRRFVPLVLRLADSVHLRALRDRTCRSQYKTDFRYALTHELRTLLRSMHQLTGALATGRAPSETRRQTWYEVLHRESEPLGRLVKRLLDFGRMKAAYWNIASRYCMRAKSSARWG